MTVLKSYLSFLGATLHGFQDPSSSTRDQTCVLHSKSVES